MRVAISVLSLCSPEILRQYAGRERQLWAKLHKKYGIPGSATSSTVKPVSSDKSRTQLSEKPPAYDPAFKPYALKRGSDSDPLDLRSSAFNTLQALDAGEKTVALLVQGTFPLDNIQKCRHLVRKGRSVVSLSLSHLLTLSQLPESDQHYQKRLATVKPSAKADTTVVTKAKPEKPASSSLFDRLAGEQWPPVCSWSLFTNHSA